MRRGLLLLLLLWALIAAQHAESDGAPSDKGRDSESKGSQAAADWEEAGEGGARGVGKEGGGGTEEMMRRGLMGTDDAKLKMEALGPVVLGKDGSMSLIGNWAELTEAERAAAWKGVAARNAKRKAALLKRKAAEKAKRKAPLAQLRRWLQRPWGSLGDACTWMRTRLRRPVRLPSSS